MGSSHGEQRRRRTRRSAWRAGSVTAVALLVVLAGNAPARAAVRSGSMTFNTNNPQPTFANNPQFPPVTVTVGYDDQAGTIAVSETGGDAHYDTGFAGFDGISITGPTGNEVDISGYWTDPKYSSPTLSESGIGGALSASSYTVSPDGSTRTAEWTSSLLVGLNLTSATISQQQSGDSDCSCDVEITGQFYFPGYQPTVVIAADPQQAGKVGQKVTAPVAIHELGLVPGDTCDNINPSVCGTTSVTGLPPGLRWTGHSIAGRLTRAGTFTTVITAKRAYAGATAMASSTQTITWTVRPTRPLAVEWDGAPYKGKGLAVRPRWFSYTGDGSGIFAGLGRFGKITRRPIRWISWTPSHAVGYGADWQRFCRACTNRNEMPYPVKIELLRPEIWDGYVVFTMFRATYTHAVPEFGHRIWTSRLHLEQGAFYWTP